MLKKMCALAAGLAFVSVTLLGVAPAEASSPAFSWPSMVWTSHRLAAFSPPARLSSRVILPAADPLDLSGSQLYDPNGVLGSGIYQVKTSIQSLAAHHMKLYVAILDNYSGYTPEEWNSKTAELSKMGADSYLISLNLTDKQFSASSTSGSALNSAEVNDLATNFASPQFSTQEYASGISSFAQQIVQRAMATPSATETGSTADAAQASTNRWLIALLLAAMVVAVVLAVAIYRRNSGSSSRKSPRVHLNEANRDVRVEPAQLATNPVRNDFPRPPTVATTPLPTGDAGQPEINSPAQQQAAQFAATDVSNQNANHQEMELPSGSPAEMDEEANYATILNRLAKLTYSLWSAQEDLTAAQLLTDPSDMDSFRTVLDEVQASIGTFFAELSEADGIVTGANFLTVTRALDGLEQHLKAAVSQFVHDRYPLDYTAHNLNNLANLWNHSRQELKLSQQAQQGLEETVAASVWQHCKADLDQSMRLLKGSYRGILAGQQSLKSGDKNMASRYARGAQRALVQSRLAAGMVKNLQTFLGVVNGELNSLRTSLSGDLASIRSNEARATGPELAMTDRALEESNAALNGKANPIESLIKLRSAQLNLYRAFRGQAEIQARLSEVSSELPDRFQQTSQLRSLLEADLMLRRKITAPQILVDLARCDQLFQQAGIKMQNDSLTALSMLNTCNEMLILVNHDLPIGFTQAQ